MPDIRNALTGQPIADSIANAYREAIPAHYRLFLSSMLGDRSPITAQNFSPTELLALRSLISMDQHALPARTRQNETRAQLSNALAEQYARRAAQPAADRAKSGKWAESPADLARLSAEFSGEATKAADRANRARQGIGAIKYYTDEDTRDAASAYPGEVQRPLSSIEQQSGARVHIGPLTAGVDYGDRNTNAIANSLGEFVYKTTPDGGAQINDNYNWSHAIEDSNPPTWGAAVRQLVKYGDFEGLAAKIIPNAQGGRPVQIDLPPENALRIGR